jgi:hypothetical protein
MVLFLGQYYKELPSFSFSFLQLGSFLRFQLPPRRFFTWWCGGMTVIDAFVLGVYLAFNIW